MGCVAFVLKWGVELEWCGGRTVIVFYPFRPFKVQMTCKATRSLVKSNAASKAHSTKQMGMELNRCLYDDDDRGCRLF